MIYKPIWFMGNISELPGYYFSIQKKLKKENCQVFIALGGDDFSPYYGYFQLFKNLLEIKLYSKKIPTVLLGQTIGPFPTAVRPMIRWFLKESYLSIRDEINFHYVKEALELRQVTLSGDLAFLNLPFQDNADEKSFIFTQYPLVENQYISVVPSGLTQAYTHNEQKYIENYVEIINFLAGFQETKNLKLVLLAHVLQNDKTDDRMIIQKIYSSLEGTVQKKAVCVLEPLLPYQLRIILGSGRFTITGRMHAAISTFQMGKPAICLSYSIKYSGVIGKGLAMEGLLLECAGAKYWENHEVSRKIIALIQELFHSYGNTCFSITRNLADLQEKIKKEIDHLCSFLLQLGSGK